LPITNRSIRVTPRDTHLLREFPMMHPVHLHTTRRAARIAVTLLACALSSSVAGAQAPAPLAKAAAPSPDPRLTLKAGVHDAGQAIWNLKLLSNSPAPARFATTMNSDIAFTGNYAIQGNFNGFQVWDITDRSKPVLATEYFCPASQSDVSVYKHLLFVSGEGMEGRLDCKEGGVPAAVSADRLRGIRIFDISDIKNPKYIGNVQTCRGSHTHSLLVDPKDPANVYVYISGSAPVRPEAELPGCIGEAPSKNPNSALFRVEVIKVPVAHPEQAAVVNTARIFEGLQEAPAHGVSPADVEELAKAKAAGAFTATVGGEEMILPNGFVAQLLAEQTKARGGAGAPTAADSAALRAALPAMIAQMVGGSAADASGPKPGPNQCHDITLYPELGLAGGACEGYGLLLDISDPANPRRIDAVSDSNFAYWHSASFSNDGSKILFTDEWGGGTGAKCRAGDPREWGANAIFTVKDRKMTFASYYKLPVAQSSVENCVAHNGSLIPVPGRDIKAQAWYQGGISVFDWTDPTKPIEIAYFDRGPLSATDLEAAGPWSVYWYNGALVSSEIARGLDILELVPNALLTQNEIDAAKSVTFEQFNAQMQPKFVWAPSFAVARAYVDQLQRSGGLNSARLAAVRQALTAAERGSGTARRTGLNRLGTQLRGYEAASSDAAKLRLLADVVRELAAK
jgi:hypothetical protein